MGKKQAKVVESLCTQLEELRAIARAVVLASGRSRVSGGTSDRDFWLAALDALEELVFTREEREDTSTQ
jgi:hypothetical protein